MKHLHTMGEAMEVLHAYVPNVSAFRNDYTLDRMREFMAWLGNPQNAYPSIHIAGTSGKTSTAYFVRSLLQNAGQATGLTVSPHIVSVTERAQINGLPLPDAEFVAYLNRFLPLAEASGIRLTYFELLMAFAYWVFAECSVRYAVIETGLGGLLDASNVITRPDKLCIITDIGLDHTEILGETIEEIAFQKAGIIQPGNQVILTEQGQTAVEMVRAEAAKRQASVRLVAPITGDILPGVPPFQRRNMAAAIAAYEYVAERDGLEPLSAGAIRTASTHTPPGRMERREVAGRTVILDGAHNPQKLLALRAALEESGVRSAAVVAGFLQAPEQKIDDSLAALQPCASHLIATDFAGVNDIGKKSVPANELADRARRLGFQSVQTCPELPGAIAALLDRPESYLLVTGSLYLVGQARKLL